MNWGATNTNDQIAQRVLITQTILLEEAKFRLAKGILFGIGTLFTLGGLAYTFTPATGKEIFEKCVTLLPPITTLVLGYYFGTKNNA